MNRSDGDPPDAMNWFTPFLAGDQFVSPDRKGCCDVESIEGRKTTLNGDLKRILHKSLIRRRPEANRLKKTAVETTLSFLAVEGGFWEDFQTNISTGCKDDFPISENRPRLGEHLWSSTGGGNQDSRVNERDLQSSASLTPPRRSAISRSRPSQSSQGLPERAYS